MISLEKFEVKKKQEIPTAKMIINQYLKFGLSSFNFDFRYRIAYFANAWQICK